MDYFMLRTMGATNDPSLCILQDPPEGLGRHDYGLTSGQTMGAHWSPKARLLMDPDIPGMKLSTVVGTAMAFLVCHRDMMAVIREVCHNEIEFLPVEIYNQRGKLVSSDYGVLNVIGTVDCLDEKASQVKKTSKGTIVIIKTPTIDAKRLAPDLHLFRLAAKPEKLIMSETLGRALAKRKFTNVVFDEVKVING
jgi:hypothetical protein